MNGPQFAYKGPTVSQLTEISFKKSQRFHQISKDSLARAQLSSLEI